MAFLRSVSHKKTTQCISLKLIHDFIKFLNFDNMYLQLKHIQEYININKNKKITKFFSINMYTNHLTIFQQNLMLNDLMLKCKKWKWYDFYNISNVMVLKMSIHFNVLFHFTFYSCFSLLISVLFLSHANFNQREVTLNDFLTKI